MMTEPDRTTDGRTVTVRVPISIRRRGGRKLVLAPDGTNVTTAPVCRHIDNAMVKAIARAFRWRELLEKGDYQTIREIANAEKINVTYVGPRAAADAAGAGSSRRSWLDGSRRCGGWTAWGGGFRGCGQNRDRHFCDPRRAV